ncbi:glycosyltransferase [Salinibacterium sp. GXW1014]|uniref:glycosyltransferase n=1 Tax=Salinibacterium sp. GXW1014 TaxID=3377838 RepID=UPI00383B5232
MITANSGSASTPPTRSSFSQLLDQLLAEPAITPSIAEHLAAVRAELDAPPQADAPFLSVLMRTQGKRIEPIKDAMLCLAAQVDEDFELILLAHNVDADTISQLEQIVAAYPARFSNRVRVIDVQGGGRGRPLNVGLEEARGDYVVVFDDDDIVMADWVERFHEAATISRGRVLRADAALQKVNETSWPDGRSGFLTHSRADAAYRKDFDFARNYEANQTPFMALAFPASLFKKLGSRVDESLPVCEDWDLIVRASSTCGVTEVHALTSVYRRWDSVGHSSYTVHAAEEWQDAEARIIEKANSSVQLFPPGIVVRLSSMLKHEGAAPVLDQLTSTLSWRVTKPLRTVRGALGRALGRARGRLRRFSL